MMGEHVLVPGALFLMAMGFCFGIALGIRDKTMRTVARVLSFVPAIIAYLALKPPSFGNSVSVQLSTSQWIALSSALIVSYFYAQYWEAARRNPTIAMNLASLGPAMEVRPETKGAAETGEEEPSEADEPDITVAAAPEPKRKKKKGSRAKRAEVEAAQAGETESEGATSDPPVAPEAKPEPDPASAEEAKP
jgi:phosphatidylglycerol:prolipoprotein diacylglycerol transferase